MHFKSFYKIYYQHRFTKANFFRKIYLIIILPIEYLINSFLLPKITDLDELSKNSTDLHAKNFEFLFNYFNTDKGSKFIDQYPKLRKQKKIFIKGHGYHSFYEIYLKKFKDIKINILELGTFKGNASAAFYFFFRNATIYCADINPDMFLYSSNRIKNFKLDTSSQIDLEKKILNDNKSYDVIIEDAGHFLKDQIISLFYLFPVLKSKGIFIIEELDFPDTRQDMNINNERPTLREILSCVNTKKNFNSSYIPEDKKNYFLENVKKIEIFKGNFNQIAFIEKK